MIGMKFDIKINYLHYFTLRNAIRRGFDVSCIRKMSEPFIPGTLILIFKGKKGCSHFYHSLLRKKSKELVCKIFFKCASMLVLDCTDWRSYCLFPFISTIDVNMRWFQYKLLHEYCT